MKLNIMILIIFIVLFGCSLDENINKNIEYSGIYYTAVFVDFNCSNGTAAIKSGYPVVVVNGNIIDSEKYDVQLTDQGYTSITFDRSENSNTFKAGNSYALDITFPEQTIDTVTYDEYEINLTVEIPLYREYMYLGRQTIVFSEVTP